MMRWIASLIGAWLLFLIQLPAAPPSFRFIILGDRTGEAQRDIYEQIWREIAATQPAFVITTGDTIEGLDDSTAESQWRQWEKIIRPYHGIPLYLTPGNHDIWSPRSEALFQQYASHPLHYSFDYEQAHFTVLDNSQSDALSPAEFQFLEADLSRHAAQPLKFVISHRPSWLIDAAVTNTSAPFHQLMKKYGVQFVLAGHVHQMIYAKVEGISYVSLPSAGGHLRVSGAYKDGWFFGYTMVQVNGKTAEFQIRQSGSKAATTLDDWGLLGLTQKSAGTPVTVP
jgi:3',5'-cyclic AMP phosphodiesterase CpdA